MSNPCIPCPPSLKGDLHAPAIIAVLSSTLLLACPLAAWLWLTTSACALPAGWPHELAVQICLRAALKHPGLQWGLAHPAHLCRELLEAFCAYVWPQEHSARMQEDAGTAALETLQV